MMTARRIVRTQRKASNPTSQQAAPRRRSLSAASAVLLGLSGAAATGPAQASVAPGSQALEARVATVREALRAPESLTMRFDNGMVAQWGNWPNWANWANWNNWNNWANWGNWFNR